MPLYLCGHTAPKSPPLDEHFRGPWKRRLCAPCTEWTSAYMSDFGYAAERKWRLPALRAGRLALTCFDWSQPILYAQAKRIRALAGHRELVKWRGPQGAKILFGHLLVYARKRKGYRFWIDCPPELTYWLTLIDSKSAYKFVSRKFDYEDNTMVKNLREIGPTFSWKRKELVPLIASPVPESRLLGLTLMSSTLTSCQNSISADVQSPVEPKR